MTDWLVEFARGGQESKFQIEMSRARGSSAKAKHLARSLLTFFGHAASGNTYVIVSCNSCGGHESSLVMICYVRPVTLR